MTGQAYHALHKLQGILCHEALGCLYSFMIVCVSAWGGGAGTCCFNCECCFFRRASFFVVLDA